MSGGMGAYSQPKDTGQLLRGMQKRTAYEERRPQIRSASDLLGPGFASKAVRTLDWNADELAFNGLFYSEPGALNSPDVNRYWMGLVEATDAGFGFQRVMEYRNADNPDVAPDEWVRTFTSAGGARTYSTWENTRSGQIRKVVSTSVTTASASTGASTGFITAVIPFAVAGRTYRATLQTMMQNDLAGAFTTLDMRVGAPVSTSSGSIMNGIKDHRLAGRREMVTMVGEYTFGGPTGTLNLGVMASFLAGSGNSQQYADAFRPTLLTVDEIIP